MYDRKEMVRQTYNSGHARSRAAIAAVAQTRVDHLAYRLGAGVLAGVRRAEFFVFLRPWQCADRRGAVAGESADFFVGGVRFAALSEFVHGGPGGRAAHGPSPYWWHGIYVRSGAAADGALAEFVSRGDATGIAVGDLAARLRSPRLEGANADGMDRGAD